MPYTHRQIREAFHLLFLERLVQLTDPRLYALKGGANLRFFFGSPRYSEDMDLDALGGSVQTLKKNGYRVLNDRSFRRSLAALGVADLEVGDPERAKHTATTQRFRARLVTAAGEVWPTKVEFSRRPYVQPVAETGASMVVGTVSPELMRAYRRLAFQCQHYAGGAAVVQKLSALANRAQPQVRDAFDLYVLWLGGHWGDAAATLAGEERERAQETLVAFTYADYRDQVVDYIAPEVAAEYATAERWNDICGVLFELLDTGQS